MKVWAACVSSNGGDDSLFVSLTESGIEDQILALARYEMGDYYREEYEERKDDYLDYDHYLLEHYYVRAREEIDL